MHLKIVENPEEVKMKKFTYGNIRRDYFFNDRDKVNLYIGCQELEQLRGLAMIRQDLSVYIEWPILQLEGLINHLRGKNLEYIRFESDDEEIIILLSLEFFDVMVEDPFKIGIFSHDLSTNSENLNPNVRIISEADYELAFSWRLVMYHEAWRWNVQDPLTIEAAESDATRYINNCQLKVLYEEGIPVCCASVIKRSSYVVFENVYVPKEHRGKGYSKKLMLHCLAEASSQGFAMVTTPWPVAINLYQSIGFKRIGDFYSYQNK